MAVTQLHDSRLWKPVLWATLLSLGTIFVAMLIGGTLVFQMVDSFSQSLTGWMSWADGWLGGLAAFLGTFFIGMVGYFFSGQCLCSIFGYFFGWCPGCSSSSPLPEADWTQPPSIIESTISSLRFILWSFLVYLMATPILLVGYFLPPIGIVLQFLLGGYLLSQNMVNLLKCGFPVTKGEKKPANYSMAPWQPFYGSSQW